MIPVLRARGKSIAEAWEDALTVLWDNGIEMETSYDIEPNTGIKFPPSKDAMMTIVVEEALAEPRLHIALEGGPAELAGYKLEVVDGIKDHWVKRSPSDKTWSYTYHGRLASYGDKMNFASTKPREGGDPWVILSYAFDGCDWEGDQYGGYTTHVRRHEEIAPFDQIQHIVDTLVEAPFSRRAVASTAFPPADARVDDPPCLREIVCRGYYDGGTLKVDMHTHWRSNDAWGASLFNMYALTELLADICIRVQDTFDERHTELLGRPCPKCGGEVRDVWGISLGTTIPAYIFAPTGDSSAYIYCDSCRINPYLVLPGAYVHTADSYHIYGNDIKYFEDKFLPSLDLPAERRFWRLNTNEMREIMREGEAKERKLAESR